MSRIVPFFLLLATALLACSDDSSADPSDSGVLNQGAGDHGDGHHGDGLPENAAEALETYAEIVHASYSDAHAGAVALDDAIGSFLDDPSEQGLQAAREAWLAAREPYLQTETYRFYDGPIDNPDDGPEGLINAWPLDENYIDYVEGDPQAGIINDPDQVLSAEALLALNEAGGEKNIATGYHAIEFLLWGQDTRDDGPGDRPHTDYVDDGTADNQERRRQYLSIVSGLLVEHLQTLVDAWAPDADNYRKAFLAEDSEVGLERALTGMIVLSGFETGGERLQPALDTGDQEDEHSCFSDNTHRDMVQDVRGVQNVWLGEYTRTDGSRVSGTSIEAVVRHMDADMADRVAERLATSVELAEKLKAPFDQEIALDNEDGRKRVEGLVESLSTQEDDLSDVFMLLGLSVEIPE